MHFHAPSGDALHSTALVAAHARSLLCLLGTSSRLSRTRPSIGMAADATFSMQDDRFASLACLLPFPIGVLSNQICDSREPSLDTH